MDRERTRQFIRENISCEQYLEKSNGWQAYCCPFCGSGHDAEEAGINVYPKTKTWQCFSCGRAGDVIDLYALRTERNYMSALSSLAKNNGISIDHYKLTQEADSGRQSGENEQGYIIDLAEDKTPQNGDFKPVSATKNYSEYYKTCGNRRNQIDMAEYLKQIGISEATAAAYQLGYDPEADPANAPGVIEEEYKPHPCPRLIIPCSETHYIAQRIDGKPEFAEMFPKGSEPAIFNAQALANDPEFIYITGSAIDALSVIDAAARPAIGINKADDIDLLIKLLEEKTPAATFIISMPNDKTGQEAAQRLREEMRRLKLSFITANISGGRKTANEALTAGRQVFIEAIEEARQRAEEQKEQRQRTGESMVDLFLQTIRTTKYEPMPTGITDIDNAIGGGFLRQQIVLLGAAPGMGKTALAQWIFEGMAERGQSCLYLNLEMGRDQMLARSLSRIAKQDGKTIKATDILQGYKWDLDQTAIANAAAAKYKERIAPRMIYNPDGITAELDSILSYLETEAQRAKQAGQPVPCVVLDYLQLVRGREREDTASTLKRAMANLKDFAIKNDTFVFAIIAHNRNTNKSGDVTMEAGRDTSALEYGADLQLGLAYTACLGKDGKIAEELTPAERSKVTLKVTKSRWSKAGISVNLFFDGETMTYNQLAPAYMENEDRPWKPGDPLPNKI